MKVFIYALKDPRLEKLGEVRYIGKTNNPKRRIWEHIRHSSSNIYKNRWIKTLTKIGLKPVMEILEEVDENNWQEKEKFFIKKIYRKRT